MQIGVSEVVESLRASQAKFVHNLVQKIDDVHQVIDEQDGVISDSDDRLAEHKGEIRDETERLERLIQETNERTDGRLTQWMQVLAEGVRRIRGDLDPQIQGNAYQITQILVGQKSILKRLKAQEDAVADLTVLLKEVHAKVYATEAPLE